MTSEYMDRRASLSMNYSPLGVIADSIRNPGLLDFLDPGSSPG